MGVPRDAVTTAPRRWGGAVRLGLLAAALIVVADVRAAEAQVIGYAIAGPAGFSGFFGSASSAVHAAAGIEALGWRRIGVGGEVGALRNSGSVLLVTSANGVVHLLASPARRGVSPFVTGGYTRMSNADGSFDAWNVGAGVDLWMLDHFGVRLEFRDHVRPDRRGKVQYWTFRAGVAFK